MKSKLIEKDEKSRKNKVSLKLHKIFPKKTFFNFLIL